MLENLEINKDNLSDGIFLSLLANVSENYNILMKKEDIDVDTNTKILSQLTEAYSFFTQIKESSLVTELSLIKNEFDKLRLEFSDMSNFKGDTGQIGVKGLKGDKGDTGKTGAKGLKGDKGDTTGVKGDTGQTGAKGIKGDTGLTGKNGAKGAKGDTGLTGKDGAKGAKGDTGLTGAKEDKEDKEDIDSSYTEQSMEEEDSRLWSGNLNSGVINLVVNFVDYETFVFEYIDKSSSSDGVFEVGQDALMMEGNFSNDFVSLKFQQPNIIDVSFSTSAYFLTAIIGIE